MMSFYSQSNMRKTGPVSACRKHPVIAVSVLQAQDGVGGGHSTMCMGPSEQSLTEDVCTLSVLPNRFSATLTPLCYIIFS